MDELTYNLNLSILAVGVQPIGRYTRVSPRIRAVDAGHLQTAVFSLCNAGVVEVDRFPVLQPLVLEMVALIGVRCSSACEHQLTAVADGLGGRVRWRLDLRPNCNR